MTTKDEADSPVPPAVGEFALQERTKLLSDNAGLRARLAKYEDDQGNPKATPSAKWRAEGEPDPHAGRYDCERAELAMGDLTDDGLANGAFMNYDAPLNLAGILAGTHSSPIAWMTAVKDRIRWLSRSLEQARAALSAPSHGEQVRQMVPEGKIAVTGEALRTVLNALVNAPHQIRELQATREPASLFADNPINVLIAEYEAAHAAPSAGSQEQG